MLAMLSLGNYDPACEDLTATFTLQMSQCAPSRKAAGSLSCGETTVPGTRSIVSYNFSSTLLRSIQGVESHLLGAGELQGYMV